MWSGRLRWLAGFFGCRSATIELPHIVCIQAILHYWRWPQLGHRVRAVVFGDYRVGEFADRNAFGVWLTGAARIQFNVYHFRRIDVAVVLGMHVAAGKLCGRIRLFSRSLKRNQVQAEKNP